MNNQITSRDIELLSAYLDNQLSSKDRASIEARLTVEPELRKELQSLDQARQLLHQLPRYRAPRNYYLKPEMIRPARTLKLAPIFGVVSAVASVLLAVVIIGSRLVTTASPVAMSPAAAIPTETITFQQEIARSAPAAESPTEAAPLIAMGAPAMDTPTPFVPPAETGEEQAPTPTTIYLYAYPPTSTSEAGMSIAGIMVATPTVSCEENYDTEPRLDLPDYYYCPTVTPSQLGIFESMPVQATQTQTLTSSPEPSGTPAPTDTPTATDTPSPTETPTPSSTPAPSATPTPFYTSTSLPALKAVPPSALDNYGVITPTTPLLGAANPTTPVPEETPSPSSESSILSYILLSVEISLAVIVVIAGITAIILRIRAR